MKVIETTAPISIDLLKEYFVNKDIKYIIDYENSTLKGAKLLTYLSNLDIPVDISADLDSEEFSTLLKDYFNSPFLVNIELLEMIATHVLLCNKGLLNDDSTAKFISENKEIVDKWSNVLDSLSLYNLYIVEIPELKEFVTSHEKPADEGLPGINFVSLLKNSFFYEFYEKVDTENVKYYEKYFNEYIFKGKNLYSFWANDKNPMFLITYGVAAGLDHGEFLEELQAASKEFNISDVSKTPIEAHS